MRALGADIELVDGFIHATVEGRLKGAELNLGKITVTGTENLIMAATLAEGQTIIHNAACEPEVQDLANFLNKMGLGFRGRGPIQSLLMELIDYRAAVIAFCRIGLKPALISWRQR